MKNQLFALIGLGLLLATASAYAQTGVVKANVPFNFIVNKTELARWGIQDPASGPHRQRDVDSEPRRQSRQGVLAERLHNRLRRQRLASWFSTATAPSTSWPRSGRQETTGDRNCRRAGSKAKLPGTIRPRVLS